MQVPQAVAYAVQQLNTAGFEAYPVGGCVRDLLRGLQPHDWDITTSATPDEMMAVFAGERLIPTGLQHGTVTLLKDGLPLEITTFRIDGAYADGRHPESVTFSQSLTEDLARRDFTVNAMALDLKNGVVDLFFGENDLQGKIIRCVGDPDKRFDEDALRVLRALRFSAVLGFTIEPETAAAIHRHKEHLQAVSAERITEEMTKLLCGKHVGNVLREFRDVLAFLVPEISPLIGFAQHSPYHAYDIFEHTVRALDAVKPEPCLRWAMLLHDIGKAKCFTLDKDGIGHFFGHASHSKRMAETILKRFRMSNKQTERILTLVKYHDLPIPPDEVLLAKRLNKFGQEILLQLLELQDADCAAQAPELTEARQAEHRQVRGMIAQLCGEGRCYSLRDLAISGDELLSLGVPAGPAVGKLLHELLNAVMENRVANEKTALLEQAKKMASL